MTKEEIIEIAKQIGLEKGYRIDCPEDWYGGISCSDTYKIARGIQKHFKTLNNTIRACFPDYDFLEWKFKKVENGFWNDFETLKEFLLPKCNELGRMLITREILEIKGLNHAIKLHGGIREVAKKLNVSTGYGFKTLSGNIVKSSYEVLLDNFLFLNNIEYKYEGKISNEHNYLFDFKINDFFIEIWGFRSLDIHNNTTKKYKKSREKKEKLYKSENLKLISLNYDFFTRNTKKIYEDLKHIFKIHHIKFSDFYVGDLSKLSYFEHYGKEEVLKELIDAFDKLEVSKFPSKKWWTQNGFNRHISFLDRNKISIPYILNRFNIKDSHMNNKPNKFKNWELTKKELQKIYLDIGKFPTQKFLIENNKQSLVKSIYKYHNGLTGVALRMGFSPKNKPLGYWLDFENLKKEITLIINENKKFPTTNYLREINRQDMVSAIYKYYGGILNVKNKFYNEI